MLPGSISAQPRDEEADDTVKDEHERDGLGRVATGQVLDEDDADVDGTDHVDYYQCPFDGQKDGVLVGHGGRWNGSTVATTTELDSRYKRLSFYDQSNELQLNN